MAKIVQGATFVSKGTEYILDYGPKGNLRPYTGGPVKKAMKTRNPYIIGGAVVLAVVVGIGVWYCNKRKHNN